MTTYVENVHLDTVHCCECAVLFAFPRELMQRRLNDHQSFWCPSGHEQHFTGLSRAEKLARELEREREMRAAEQARAGRVAAERDEAKKAHKRMRERIMNGVCPCCNRTFQNLLRHMTTEHSGELTLRAMRAAFGMTQAGLARELDLSVAHISRYENQHPVSGRAIRKIEGWRESVTKSTQ